MSSRDNSEAPRTAGAPTAVRRLSSEDVPTVQEIVRALPDYFTNDVPDKVATDAAKGSGWVVVSSETTVGFAVASQRSAAAAEILWMAIHPAWRGQGAGTALLDRVLEDLEAAGVSVVEVKTLDASADYEPYEATRAFWEKRGFVHVDTIDPLPGWQPGNPCALYVAALRPTR